jgi:hypothetical protein
MPALRLRFWLRVFFLFNRSHSLNRVCAVYGIVSGGAKYNEARNECYEELNC